MIPAVKQGYKEEDALQDASRTEEEEVPSMMRLFEAKIEEERKIKVAQEMKIVLEKKTEQTRHDVNPASIAEIIKKTRESNAEEVKKEKQILKEKQSRTIKQDRLILRMLRLQRLLRKERERARLTQKLQLKRHNLKLKQLLLKQLRNLKIKQPKLLPVLKLKKS